MIVFVGSHLVEPTHTICILEFTFNYTHGHKYLRIIIYTNFQRQKSGMENIRTFFRPRV